jgi:hypothetical protein
MSGRKKFAASQFSRNSAFVTAKTLIAALAR